MRSVETGQAGNRVAPSMNKVSLILLLSSVTLLTACGGSSGSGPNPTTSPTPAPSTVVKDINYYRAQNGLKPVAHSEKATRAARRHAMDMAVNDFFDHKGSDGSGPADRLRDVGCSGVLAENLAWGEKFNRESVVEAWMGSPGHRENMLLKDVTVYGLEEVNDEWVMTLAGSC